MSDEPPVAVAVPAAAEDEGKEEDLTANEAGDAPNAGVTPAENQVCASPQLEHYLFVLRRRLNVKSKNSLVLKGRDFQLSESCLPCLLSRYVVHGRLCKMLPFSKHVCPT